MLLLGIVFVMAFLILGGNAYFTNKRVKTATDRALSCNRQIGEVAAMQHLHLALLLNARNAIVAKDEGQIPPERMTSINANVQNISEKLKELERLADSHNMPEATRRIQANFKKLARGIQVDLVRLIHSGAGDEAFARTDNIIDDYGSQIENDLSNIASSLREEQQEANEHLDGMLASSSMIGYLIFIFSVGISLPILFLISRSIVKPIRNTIREINHGAEQVAYASGHISAASHSLAEGSSEQAASIEETSSSLEEMSSMTKQNAEHAGQANTLMKESSAIIEKANASMNEVTTSMAEISETSEETQKIVKTIDEIAFQTNLLALNAAVEAARAGEAGAGFAVVADEVRNLAMRAAEAAKNTSVLIAGTVKKINDGSELVIRTNDAFSEVTSSSTKVGELVAEIAAASNEQAQGIEQINAAVNDMDKVTQQSAAYAEEYAGAAQELNAQAEETKCGVEKLKIIVEGSVNLMKTNKVARAAANPNYTKAPDLRRPEVAPTNKIMSAHKGVSPEQIIPLDEDDFSEF